MSLLPLRRPTGYEPLSTLKPVAEGIWLADGPAISFYGIPFPTRMTVIRLTDGGLWVHSPIDLTQGLRTEVQKLGPVKCLVAPNWIHYAYLPAWQAEFPETESYAAPNVVSRAQKHGLTLRVDHELSDTPPRQWDTELEQLVVRGSMAHVEVVFFHRASRTLILTDLIENFEPEKLPVWARPLVWAAGNRTPYGGMPQDMRLTFRLNRKENGLRLLTTAIEKMLSWQPERIVLAHGRWFETDGTAALKRSFAWLGV